MGLGVSLKIPLDSVIQQVQQGTSKMKLKWRRTQKEYDNWLRNPVTMARMTLLVKTKDKSVRVKPCFNNDLYRKLERMINVEPAKAFMLIKGASHLRNDEKVELFKSLWIRASKASMSKVARSLSADEIANAWNKTMNDLENNHSTVFAAGSGQEGLGARSQWFHSTVSRQASALLQPGRPMRKYTVYRR